MGRNKWHLLSPENYNKVFDVLSQRYPKFFMRGKVFIFKKGIHRDDNKLELVDANAVNVNGDEPKLGINFKVENKNE